MKKDKQLIHQACLKKQQSLIDGFSSRLESLESDVSRHGASPSQTESRMVSKLDLINTVHKELDFAKQEMAFLNNLDPSKASDTVEPGAVVVTNKLTFYICVSIEKFEVEGDELFGISFKAPIYANMVGLKKGDKFKYNETEYEILDIF